MGVTRASLLVFAAACFKPAPQAGAPCAEGNKCPEGLECIGGTCELPGTMLDAARDAPLIDAAIDVPPDGPSLWSTPTPIPGVNSASTEADPTFTADRLTIVFVRSDNLFIGTRANVAMPFTVTELTALNSSAGEASPEISADGNTLYFTSDRLVAGDDDVYVSIKGTGGFTTATRIDELSTTTDDEDDIAVSADGLTAIVGRSGLRRATRSIGGSWSAPALIANIAGSDPNAPSLTANGDIYYHATPTPNRDLYVVRRMGTTYVNAVPLTELNTSGRDAGPAISADEKYLWFERNGDLYESTKP